MRGSNKEGSWQWGENSALAKRFHFTCIFLALLLDPGAQDPGEPANQVAEQGEIQHVVHRELQRLRGHLLQLGLVRVLHPCERSTAPR